MTSKIEWATVGTLAFTIVVSGCASPGSKVPAPAATQPAAADAVIQVRGLSCPF